jgi:hypothetical protein
MQTGDQLPNPSLGKTLGAQRMILLQTVQSFFQVTEFFLRLPVLLGTRNHNRISTSRFAIGS